MLFLTSSFRLHKLLYIILLLPLSSLAGNNKQLLQDELITHAIEKVLWNKTEWLNLLHYNKDNNSYRSQVDDDRFFYAVDGNTNPEAELLENIKQLFILTEDNNKQVQCQFVARTGWLLKQLNVDRQQLPAVRCDDYMKWRQQTQADSVTMIFPAYNLNSPSSMFGHTLLRLDNSKKSQSEWLSLAVNFGANIGDDDNSLLYPLRGITGGYPGQFVTQPYFKKIQEYNRIEHRDIWEYKLNLTAEETEIMLKHLWELKTINFDYYFFDENCSYRILELIEVARPAVELTDEFVITAIPVDTIRAIEKAQLIKSINYRPAQVTEIQFALDTIPDHQRNIVLQLSEDINVSNSDEFTTLSQEEQKKIVNLAYKYLRYQNTKKARDPVIAKRSYQLLKLTSSYPADIKISNTIPKPVAPEDAHRSKRVTTALGKRLDNYYAELGFKMAFHDLEDNKNGFLQGAQINVTNIKLRVIDNVGVRLHRLDIADVLSLTPRNSFFKPLSWKIYSGFERELTDGKDQLIYHITGGAGGTWEYIKNHKFYALAIGRIETNKQLKNFFEPAIGFNSGFLSHFKHTTAHLKFSGEQFQEDIYRLRIEYIQNIVLSTNHSIKLSAKHQWQDNNTDFSDINLNYQYYF